MTPTPQKQIDFKARAAAGWATRRLKMQAALVAAAAAPAPAPEVIPAPPEAPAPKQKPVKPASKGKTIPCACNCKKRIPVASNPMKQTRFAWGHDAKAKSQLCQVEKGRISVTDLPQILIDSAPLIPSISGNPRFMKLILQAKTLKAKAA